MRACRHEDLRRSQRRRWESLAAIVRLRPYRCRLCHKRVWRYAGRAWLELPLLAAVLLLIAYWRLNPGPGEILYPTAPLPRLEQAEPEFPEAGSSAELAERSPVVAEPSLGRAEPTLDTVAPSPDVSSPTRRSGVSREQPANDASASEFTARATPAPAPQAVAGPAIAPAAPPVIVPTVAPPASARPAPQSSPAKPLPATPPPLRLLGLKASERDGRFQLRVRHGGQAIEARLARLAGPSRLFLDLPGRWDVADEQPQTLSIDGQIVQRVRLGLHRDKLRIVMDMANVSGVRQRLVAEPGTVELLLVSGAN